jgi:hypothetical protein
MKGKCIKLTQTNSDTPVWIFVDHIVLLVDTNAGTRIRVAHGESLSVVESVDKVLGLIGGAEGASPAQPISPPSSPATTPLAKSTRAKKSR